MPGRNIHYGWIIVCAAFVLIFLDGLLLYTFGVFKPYLSEAVQLTETAVASIFSVRCVTLAISMPLAGKLAERFAPRWVILCGGILASSGFYLASTADSIGELYLYYGFLVGLGDGAFYTLPVAIISRWFKKNRALAIGIATTGLPVSGLVISPISAWLVHVYSLERAFVVCAVILLTISFAGFILRKDPSEMGQTPVGGTEEDRGADPDAGSVRALDAIKQKDFWILYFIFWAGFNTFLIVIINLYNFALDQGLSEHIFINFGLWEMDTLKAAIPPALIGLGSVIGRIFFSGYALKFLNESRVLLVCYLCKAVLITLVLVFIGEWAFYVFGFLFGFFYSGWVPIFPIILGNLYGLRELGAIFGFFGSGFSLAALTGPITAGLLRDSLGGYSPMFIAAVAFCILAAALTFFIRTSGREETA